MSESNCVIKFDELQDLLWSPGGTVCIATGVRAGRPGIRFTTRQIFSLLPQRPDLLWGSCSLLLNGHRGALPGIKRPEREVDNLSPSSAEIKNGQRYTSVPLIRRREGKFCIYLEVDTPSSCKLRRCSAGQNLSKTNWIKYTPDALCVTHI